MYMRSRVNEMRDPFHFISFHSNNVYKNIWDALSGFIGLFEPLLRAYFVLKPSLMRSVFINWDLIMRRSGLGRKLVCLGLGSRQLY